MPQPEFQGLLPRLFLHLPPISHRSTATNHPFFAIAPSYCINNFDCLCTSLSTRACMHERAHLAGRDRRRPASACQLMARHSSIFSGDRPAAARARSVGRPAGCTKVHLSVFLFLLCSNHIQLDSWLYSQIRCMGTADYWVLVLCMHAPARARQQPSGMARWRCVGAGTVVMALCRA